METKKKRPRLEHKISQFKNGDRLYIHRYRLNNNAYHSITNAVSSSALKELYDSKNPYWCHKKYIERSVPQKRTDAMTIGSATHKRVLEPRAFKNEFAVWHGRRVGNKWNEFKEEHSHKDIITDIQYREIEEMREAVLKHPEASRLLSGGEAETSVFWRDEETGVLLKARADYTKIVNGSKIIIDLKTCLSAEPEAFAKQLINLSYPIQEALYRDGFEAQNFAFVCVEKVTNVVQVYTCDDLLDECGYLLYRQTLEKWANYLKNGWPTSYREGVTQLDCPQWFANKVLGG